RVQAVGSHNSLGEFYWDATAYLGFGEFAEGKTMGLAAYGDPGRFENIFSSAVQSNGTSWYDYRGWPPGAGLGCPRRTDESPLDDPYPSIAAAVQLVLESSVRKIVRSVSSGTRMRSLCLGGGVALNCSLNGSLVDSGAADSVWVFPGSSDAG